MAPRPRWGLFALLLVSVWLNYVDRGNLAVAAPLLAPELNLRPSAMGLLLSSFFWTYASCQLVAGWLVDRYDVNRVYGFGFLVWSLATGLTGAVGGFGSLLALRLVLGAGEAVAYPAYSKIVAATFPEDRRGIANALIDACTKAGPAVGVYVGGHLMAAYGWRAFFFATGFVSLLWLLPWFIYSRPARVREVASACPPWRAILRERAAWGTFVGLFGVNYAWYFLLNWLPSYFVQQRGFSKVEMANSASLPFWGIVVAAIASGWLSDRWVAQGSSVTRVRKGFVLAGLLPMGALLFPAALVTDHRVCLALLVLCGLFYGVFTSNLWAITQTLAGPAAAGRWTGAQNAIGNIGGVLSPYLTGRIVEDTGSFTLAFAIASASLLLAAASFGLLIPRVTPVNWNERLY